MRVQHGFSYNVGWSQFCALIEALPVSSQYIVKAPLKVLLGRKADDLAYRSSFTQEQQGGVLIIPKLLAISWLAGFSSTFILKNWILPLNSSVISLNIGLNLRHQGHWLCQK
jgi:hypothetical protein